MKCCFCGNTMEAAKLERNYECYNCSSIAKDSREQIVFISEDGKVYTIKKAALTEEIEKTILAEIETMFAKFEYYDRKECENLPLEKYEKLKENKDFKKYTVFAFIDQIEESYKCNLGIFSDKITFK